MKDIIKKTLRVMPVIKLILLFTLISCSTTQRKVNISSEKQKVLFNITNNNDYIYYKTITKDLGKPIAFYIKPYLLEFALCVNDIEAKSNKISNKELTFIRSQFKNQKVSRLDNFTIKLKNITHNKDNFKTSYITEPVLFRNNTMAIYYSYSNYGGGFHLLQKKEGIWSSICSNSVWIE